MGDDHTTALVVNRSRWHVGQTSLDSEWIIEQKKYTYTHGVPHFLLNHGHNLLEGGHPLLCPEPIAKNDHIRNLKEQAKSMYN